MTSKDILYAITVASKPTELILTTAGQVTYAEWCEAEKRRIERKSDWPLAIYTNPKTGEISLVLLRAKNPA